LILVSKDFSTVVNWWFLGTSVREDHVIRYSS
jgi:hypothetical protein